MRIRTIRGLGVNTHNPNLSTTKKETEWPSLFRTALTLLLCLLSLPEKTKMPKKNSYPARLFVVLPRAIQIWLYSNILS